MRRFVRTALATVTVGALGASLLTAGTSAVALGPTDTPAITVRAFDEISAIGTLGSTSRALIGAAEIASNTTQLWVSDGTSAGTTLVEETGNEGGRVADILPLDSTRSVFVNRIDGGGNELWITDGTAAGTGPVRDIWPGPNGSNPLALTRLGDRVFFTAEDGVHGRELWVSDGTSAGTMMVKDIRPGSSQVGPSVLTPSGGLLYFAADDGVVGRELWVTDGTEPGTMLVQDLNPGLAASNPELAAVPGGVIVAADDDSVGGRGRELWFSDGTPAGTIQLPQIRPGTDGAAPNELTTFGTQVLLAADDGTTGSELWTARRDAAGVWGVARVGDLRPGPLSSLPQRFVVAGDRVYFTAADDVHGAELWRTDGTPAGTGLVRDVNPGPPGSSINAPVPFRSHLVFGALTPADGQEVWASDGTASGTLLADPQFSPGPADAGSDLLHVAGETLFYLAYDQALDTSVLRTLDLARWFTGTAATPRISGAARVGRTVTAAPGAWDAGAVFGYQWLRNGTPIPGATAARYALTPRDFRARITVRVTGARPDYTPLTRVSPAVRVAVGRLSRPGRPKIAGTPRVGSRLKAKPGRWGRGVTLRYRWLRDGSPIKRATKRSYRLAPADRGSRIVVRVVAKQRGYAPAKVRSARTRTVR